MRVAALYDIHGNLPALEAVLAEVKAAGVDLILVGGDVMPGPLPRESLELLRTLDIPTRYIRGNGERAVLDCRAGRDLCEVPESFRECVRFNANQLDPALESWIASWTSTWCEHIPGLGDVQFCHATPRSDSENFTRLTPEPLLAPVFPELESKIVICGHTHMPFDRMIGKVRVVNAGSVGMPFGKTGADWLLIGPDVGHRNTSYNLDQAAERIRSTHYPLAREFAEKSVLDPPSEEDMLRVLTHASFR
jgi:predicted phosphodiesterase